MSSWNKECHDPFFILLILWCRQSWHCAVCQSVHITNIVLPCCSALSSHEIWAFRVVICGNTDGMIFSCFAWLNVQDFSSSCSSAHGHIEVLVLLFLTWVALLKTRMEIVFFSLHKDEISVMKWRLWCTGLIFGRATCSDWVFCKVNFAVLSMQGWGRRRVFWVSRLPNLLFGCSCVTLTECGRVSLILAPCLQNGDGMGD